MVARTLRGSDHPHLRQQRGAAPPTGGEVRAPLTPRRRVPLKVRRISQSPVLATIRQDLLLAVSAG